MRKLFEKQARFGMCQAAEYHGERQNAVAYILEILPKSFAFQLSRATFIYSASDLKTIFYGRLIE